ncbi:hypothetical protein N0V90_002259 [Kalmusia sp. IMI 367209]|nr:hypothetical protein N0V90_002259 [Kalmusia sp. IMI 367209]
MPFNQTRASVFITELKKYVQFQSTIEVVKNPPDTYAGPTVDIMGGLDRIKDTHYSNHFQFDLEIFNLFNSVNDGHFYLKPCSITIFNFFRKPLGLVSVSKDGRSTPEIYTAIDLKSLSAGASNVSPVTTINGQDVIKYLETIAAQTRYQDPDARWNSLFASDANLASNPEDKYGGFGAFIAGVNMFWPGVNNTRLGFKNGSSVDLPTYAKYLFNSLQPSAIDMFNFACIPRTTNGNSTSINTRQSTPTGPESNLDLLTPRATAGPAGYPMPFWRDGLNQISGYTLDNETTVMFIPTFDAGPDGQDGVFSQVASQIVNTAISNGRTKLIIDLSSNGGGNIKRAFDLFKLFFPSGFPYSATRLRRHDAVDSIVLAARKLNSTSGGSSPFTWQAFVTPAQDSGFASLDDFLKGEIQLGVNVTSLYANFNYTQLSTKDSPIRGFGPVAVNNTQPYKPEDILLITDGTCTSTCTTFVNLMTNAGGVRALTFGGRPRSEPMQVMGGVRGAQSYSFTNIDTDISDVKSLVENDTSLLTQEQIARAQASLPIGTKNMPFFISAGGVNLRNAYQEGADHLPLQFDYQASDCRLFYTAQNVREPSSSWVDAKAAVWGGRGCVTGSTGGKGSLDYRQKGNSSSSGSGSGSGIIGGDGASSAGNLQLGGSFLALCVFASSLAVIV